MMTVLRSLGEERCFKAFGTIPLMEKVIEDVKNKLYESYYIDYFGVHVLHVNESGAQHMISRLDHEEWHKFYWKDDMVLDCLSLDHLSKLKMKENAILFFQTYQSSKDYNARAEIIGRVSHGCSFLFTDPQSGYRIQFCITFKDDTSVGLLRTEILVQLVKDLSKIKGFLNPFMDYFVNVGNLTCSADLDRFVNSARGSGGVLRNGYAS